MADRHIECPCRFLDPLTGEARERRLDAEHPGEGVDSGEHRTRQVEPVALIDLRCLLGSVQRHRVHVTRCRLTTARHDHRCFGWA